MLGHPLRVLCAGAALVAVVVLAIHSAAPPQPGRTLTWAPLPATVQPSASPAEFSAVPTAAPPTSAPSGGLLGGLRVPLSALLHQLNNETKQSAVGQYSILQAITDGLRDRISQFLNWIVGKH